MINKPVAAILAICVSLVLMGGTRPSSPWVGGTAVNIGDPVTTTGTGGTGSTSEAHMCPGGTAYNDTYTPVAITATGGLNEYVSQTSYHYSNGAVVGASKHVLQTGILLNGGWNEENLGDSYNTSFFTVSCYSPPTSVTDYFPVTLLQSNGSPNTFTYNGTTYTYYAHDDSAHPIGSVEHERAGATTTIGAVRDRNVQIAILLPSPGEFVSNTGVTALSSFFVDPQWHTASGLQIILPQNGSTMLNLAADGNLAGQVVPVIVRAYSSWHTLEKKYKADLQYHNKWGDLYTVHGQVDLWKLHATTYYTRYELNFRKLMCEDASVDTRKGYSLSQTEGSQMMDANAALGDYNFSNSTYKGGLFVGLMQSGSDQSGTAMTQLYPAYSGMTNTITAGTTKYLTLSAFYLGLGAGAFGDQNITVTYPPTNDPNWNLPPSSLVQSKVWKNKTAGPMKVFNLTTPAVSSYVNWPLSLTNTSVNGLCLEMTNEDIEAGTNYWRYFASKEYQNSFSTFPASDSQPRVWQLDFTTAAQWQYVNYP